MSAASLDGDSDGRIGIRVAEGVAAVEIDNPLRQNALTRAMCLQLRDLMPRLDADPDVTVVTIRGSGRTFCSGAAIHELSSVILDGQDTGERIDHLSRADEAIASMVKPTVALVDGACMGGGWQIASACDVVLASERSVLAITPAKIGIVYPRSGVERLVRWAGPANAKYVLLTAESFGAARARELGLVTEVVPDDAFEDRCTALVDALLTRSRFSMHAMKRLVDRTAGGAEGLDAEWDAVWAAAASGPDMPIGVAAFLHHEQPRFTWGPA